MILTDLEIRQHELLGSLKITPFNPDLVNPSGLDIRLGRLFGSVEMAYGYEAIDPLDPSSFHTTWEAFDYYILQPKEFLLSCLEETIDIPKDMTAVVFGKSSLGRLGIANSSMAGLLDPQFAGVTTIEIFNYGKYPIKLTAGMKIGQLVFHRHKECQVGYAERTTSKYSNQKAGQGSKGIDKVEERE